MNNRLKAYAIINRISAQNLAVDYTSLPFKWAWNYKEARSIFEKEKENLLQLAMSENGIIVKDKNDIFCIQYGDNKTPFNRYVKIIDLY